MKRMGIVFCALTMVLLTLVGCASSVPERTPANDESQSSSVESSPEETTGAASRIEPVAPDVDMNSLDNCTVAVSFEKGDAYVDDTGKMQLKVRVYIYDVYDPADVAGMKVGDTIIIQGRDVAVTELERDASGAVLLNGGLDVGGYELITDGNGVYYAVDYDDLKLYYEVGEMTIPVSQDFLFEDSANLEKGTQTYYPGDFLTDEAGIVYDFVPNNTTITIQDGYVAAMERIYNP